MTRRFEIAMAAVAVVGLALFLLAAAGDPQGGLQGWLAAAVAWAAVSLGCLIVVLMRVLVGAGLDSGLGPALAAASGTLPVVALAFVPVLLGLSTLYPWAVVPPEGDFQKLWLQTGFFAGRNVAYFVLWVVLAALCLRNAGRGVAAAGLILVGVTGSMAAVDWIMSLEPHFHSSIYGMLFLSHAALVGWALASAAGLSAGARYGPPGSPQIAAGYMIGGIALWAYLSFCQYLIVWDGNEPHEIRWYLLRESGGWAIVFWAASILEGIVPFLFMLPARVRASRSAVTAVALILVAGGMLQMAVFVLPAFDRGMAPALPALPAAAGLGGLWLLVFGRRLRKPTALEPGHA
jgi:hypothetical protein